MKMRIILLFLISFFLIISCKKESFPDNDDLKGCWDQISSDYLLDRESLCFDGQETLFYAKIVSRAIEMDTLIYRLDKKEERLYLSLLTSPGSGESSHKILMNHDKDELTIWNLHASIPESPFESKFKKQ